MVQLPKVLFWDVDFEKLDPEKNAHFIVTRVVQRGSLDDWFAIKKYYGLDIIKDILLHTRYLDKLTLHFFSMYFNIPIEQFRCYTFQQSNPELWNY